MIKKRGQATFTVALKKVACPLLCLFLFFGCGPKHKVIWENYSVERMAEAVVSGRPVIIFFTAAWCPPCYSLKDKTFADLRVIEALEPYIRLKADMSYQHSPKIMKLGDQYQVSGLPTILLFKPFSKAPYGDLRLNGYVSPEKFLEVIQDFTNASL